jgi:hypothetical protein
VKLSDWRIWLGVLSLTATVAGGCRREHEAKSFQSRVVQPPTSLVYFTNHNVADFSLVEALERGEYAKLDSLAASLRKSKAVFDTGRWKLNEFYQQVSSVPDGSPESDYLRRIKHLQKWSNQKPPSITADIALCMAYRQYAWEARGTGYAKTISTENRRLYVERIKMAKSVLMSCQLRQKECPGWWNALQLIALDEGWDRKRYDALLAEALKQEPTFVGFYNNAACHLLRRWYGTDGEWEKFALTVADTAGGEAGDILYAQIIWRMEQMHVHGNIFKESKASWTRTRKGFEAMRRKNPESLSILTAYCHLAACGDERTLARQLFDEIGDRVDVSVWNADQYMKMRQYLAQN